MTPADNEALARRFLTAYAAKDLDTIMSSITEDVLLRDWNLEVRGAQAFRAETQRNFDDARALEVDIVQLHATPSSVAAEVLITVDGSIRLRVVDVFDVDAQGRVTAVRSYKGLEP